MLEKFDLATHFRDAVRKTDTDALRIIDGEGDGFGDLAVDDFAGHWLVETRGGHFPEWLKGAPQPRSIHWKKLGDKKTPQWVAGEKLAEPFVVRENGIKYWIDFNAGYSQGIFLDQRDNRFALRKIAPGKTVLNCFSYTCAFGLSAAVGGANTVNLDLSKRYLDWGRRNYALNGINLQRHDFIYGDVIEWLKRFYKKGRFFDIVLLDPPTFSRNEKGAVFTVESGFGMLVNEAAAILNPQGTIFCSTNQRSISPAEFRQLVSGGLKNDRGWKIKAGAMPSDFCAEAYLKTLWLCHCPIQ
jgi:23S rRNA (cytosine1962-C5)-methyltransferase